MGNLETWALWKLTTGLALIICNILVFSALRIKLIKKFLHATCRAITQLCLVGLTLSWIFKQSHWIWSLCLMVMMSCTAVWTARTRPVWRYPGISLDLFAGFLGGSWCVTLFFMTFEHSHMNWSNTSTVIPFFGFLLGNSLTGMSLTMERLVCLLSERKKHIESDLALGAERSEVFRPLFTTSLLCGLTPTLNTMTVVGIVSLPGVMTGQIMAGVHPFHAAFTQLSLLLLNAGTTSISCLIVSKMILNRFFSEQHQMSTQLWQNGHRHAFTY